ncbi:MAG: LysR family transcriptional regulator [Burkholderiales bacterium]|nr:LysR family transcriptional regulator [Burkholderiales bacterium]
MAPLSRGKRSVDLRRLDLNLLVSLDALLAERNVTRAALRLHVSQPALSAQLARLRAIFDDQLLVPSAKGMLPTPRAEALAAPLHAALRELDGLIRTPTAFDPATAERTFTIVATDYGNFAVIVPVVCQLRREAPRVRIAVREYAPTRLREQLESGEADLFLGAPRITPESLRSRKVLDERFVVVQRKDHPRGKAPLDLDAYCSLEHVLVSPGDGGFTGFMDEMLEGMGRRRNVVLAVQQFLVVPKILTRSNLVSTLPERLAEAFADELDVFDLPVVMPSFTLAASWHPRRQDDPAHQWLRDTLVEASAKGSNAATPLQVARGGRR